MPAGVYAIRHVPSGRRYVGSSKDVTNRWGNHRYWLRRGRHYCTNLQHDWDRDGETSFSFEWLEKHPTGSMTRQELEAREETYMVGELYNKSPHARGGWKLCSKTKAKLAAAALRVADDPEERQRRSERAKRQHQEGSLKGQSPSQETREKISKSLLGHGCSDATRKRMSESQKRRFSVCSGSA